MCCICWQHTFLPKHYPKVHELWGCRHSGPLLAVAVHHRWGGRHPGMLLAVAVRRRRGRRRPGPLLAVAVRRRLGQRRRPDPAFIGSLTAACQQRRWAGLV